METGTVVAFLEGRLTAAERSDVEHHIASCSACSDLVIWAGADEAQRGQPRIDKPFIGQLAPDSRVDRYHILSAIGRGGMGEVYAAYHPDLDRRIALKVVSESSAGAPERRARLLREARAIARLSHPNVITVYDAGTVGDRVYIAMEFVEGMTVDAWLRAKPRGWREILDVFVAAGQGLAAAHAAHVVHRDFKPQNVMIGRDGSVRVMDFGLARLAEEPVDPGETAGSGHAPSNLPGKITETGAVVGTPAYMAPEQFRREPLDERADQFSFCVALYEALYGGRPVLAHLRAADAPPSVASDSAIAARRVVAPAWVRSAVVRGLSEDRNERFPSMNALLAAIRRGQRRGRARAAALAIGVTAALLSLGMWRLAAGSHVSCAAPAERLAAVWAPGNAANPRRLAVHRALAAGGRPAAETVWQRVASTLDDYASRWSAMHVKTCEATHVRGEQSGEVLDLRMACLSDALDELRALTDLLARENGESFSQVVTAASNLAPLGRCADLVALRSAVPLPRDEKTARAVESLRRGLRDAVALEEVGNNRAALNAAEQLLPAAEATGYKPLIAEVQYAIGAAQCTIAPADAEVATEKALYLAEASRDDFIAAKAAISLVSTTGYSNGRRRDAQRWANLAQAILDRLASPQPLLRAWLLHNQASVLHRFGEFAQARPLLERALAMKEAELGRKHPDVARTAAALAWALTELHRPADAVLLADRAVEILGRLDPDSLQLAYALHNRGEALSMMGRYENAEESYREALRILRLQLAPTNADIAAPLFGIGEARLARADASGALPYLDESLKLRRGSADDVATADTEFLLARALVASGKDRQRARAMADSARTTFLSRDAKQKHKDVVAWLAAHQGLRR